jgi:hypothetical protein
MQKHLIFLTLWLGIKYGFIVIMATALFLPLPIMIGEYFGRMSIVDHYSDPLPGSWILGFSVAIVITLSLPLFLGVCILSSIITFSYQVGILTKSLERYSGALIGAFAVLSGSILFEKLGLLEAFGGWIFLSILLVWGIILFIWISHRIQQSIG